jgi:CheY-like chemotaxis protein
MPSVLLVDDEPDMLFVWRFILRNAGYDVRCAANGRIAFDLLLEKVADVVVSDWMMPVMNGEELCRRLRGHPAFGAVPVLIFTAMSPLPPDRKGHLWDEWLVKPATREVFLDAVAQLCKCR